MSATDFHAKLAAHRAHMSHVLFATSKVSGLLIDYTGQPLADNEPPRDGILCGDLRALLNEIERLQAREKQLLQDMREEQREFQREARDIAAEARWQERESQDPYGY